MTSRFTVFELWKALSSLLSHTAFVLCQNPRAKVCIGMPTTMCVCTTFRSFTLLRCYINTLLISQPMWKKIMCKSGILLEQIHQTHTTYCPEIKQNAKPPPPTANSNVSSCLHVSLYHTVTPISAAQRTFPGDFSFSESITLGGNFLPFPLLVKLNSTQHMYT